MNISADTPAGADDASANADDDTTANADTDTLANADFPDTSDFELPPPPIIPEDEEDKSDILTEEYIDVQSAEQSNQVSMQGITKMFLENPKLAARLGHLLLEAGYPDEAVYILQNGISRDSAPIPVLVDMAYGHFYSKDFETALGGLDSALNKYPGNADLLTAKAAILGNHPDTSQRKEADAMFKTILKKSSESAETNYQYGRYVMHKGDFKISREYLDKAVKIEPYNSRYIARLGMAEFYLRRNLEAEALYKKALKINPYDYNTWFNLGELYLSEANESGYAPEIKKKTRMALESYLKTIENDSIHINAHYRIGLILNGNGEHREAIGHLSLALKRMPGNIPTMQQLSSAYMQLGDTVKSVRYLEEILRIDPFNKIAANEYVRISKLKAEK